MRPIPLFAICILLLLQSCQDEKITTIAVTSAVAEHFTYVNSPTAFAQANQLKQAKKYRSAAKAYQYLLQTNTSLSDNEKANTWNQLIYCMITSGGQMREVALQLDSFEQAFVVDELEGGIRADYLYNKAFQLMHVGEGRPAIGMLEEGLGIYGEVYSGAHLRKVETNVLLSEALYYYSPKPNILEATFHYLDEAAEQVVGDSLLVDYAHRYFYWDGFVGFMRRTYDGGMASTNVAMNLVNDNTEIDDKLFLGKCMLSKGSLFRGMGEYKKTEIELIRAFRLIEDEEVELGDQAQFFYKELVIGYLIQKDSLNYSIWMKKASKKFKEFKFFQPQRLRAKWYFHQENYSKSASYFRKLIQILDEDESLPDRPKLYDEAYYLLGDIYRLNSKLDSSLYFISRSMTLGTELYTKKQINWIDIISEPLKKKSIHSFMDYGKLADTYFLKYRNYSKSITDLKKAEELYFITDSLLFNYSMMADENASLEFLLEVVESNYPNAIQVFYELFQLSKDVAYIEKANFFIERQKSFLLYRNMFLEDVEIAINSPMLNREKEIRQDMKKQKWLLGNGDKKNKEASLKIYKGLQEIIAMYQGYKKKHPLIYEGKMQHKIQSISEMQSTMEVGKSILQYAIAHDKICLIVIEKRRVNFLQWDKPDLFNETYANYKELLKSKEAVLSKKDFNRFVKFSYQLYNWLIVPANVTNKNVLIVTDSAYPSIPFGSLIKSCEKEYAKVDYSSLDYLIRDWTIGYTPSLKNYLYRNQTEIKLGKESKIIAFAYSDNRDGDKENSIFRSANLSELSGAAREVKSISLLFENNKGKFYYGKDSNRGKFFKEMEREYDVLHLALHSEVDIDNPLNNRLYFRNAVSSKLAKPVYSYEISSLDLKIPLVVLSSCSTGEGVVYKSEGTHSLTRAFIEAGAEEVVSTLWDVQDATTSKIIERFYSGMKNGKRVAVAIKEAKVEYLNKTDQYLSFPGYWSGVICWE